MAILVAEKGTWKISRDTQTMLDCFMAVGNIEWHEISNMPMKGRLPLETPWNHPFLEIFDESIPVSHEITDWTEYTMAIIDENGVRKNMLPNVLFPEIRGWVGFYNVYVSNDGIVKANTLTAADWPGIRHMMTQYIACHHGFTPRMASCE
jgi:hypothetical protein